MENPPFATKMKFNGLFENIPVEYGSNYRIIQGVHSFERMIPPDKYFKDHPEWFSEIMGKRVPDAQLCLTNEELLKEATRNVLEWIRQDPNAGLVSVSQNDRFRNCECEKCKAVDTAEGSTSGTLIHFVNKIAEEVEKEYPDFLVETLAYQYTRKAPLHVKPRKNVMIRLCSIECDFFQPLDSDYNGTFRDDIKAWSAISTNMFVWDYVTDFASYIQPHPNLQVYGSNLRFFANHKVFGVFEQGDSYTTIGDFIRLRTWLFGHLEWDLSKDQKKLTDEFMKGYYGAAAPYLQKHLDLMQSSFAKTGGALSCYNRNLSFLTLPVMNESTKLFEQAAEAVADNPTLTARVRRERLSLDHAWLLQYNELKKQSEEKNLPFLGPKDPKAACQEFIKLAREWKADFAAEGYQFESYVPKLEAMFP